MIFACRQRALEAGDHVLELLSQVINYDTDLPAHYTLAATFNFHDVKLNDQEQAAIRIIWNECVFGARASGFFSPWCSSYMFRLNCGLQHAACTMQDVPC